MRRYVTRPKAFVSESHTPEYQPTVTVYEAEPAPMATGLLDQFGQQIYRVDEKEPIGFNLKART